MVRSLKKPKKSKRKNKGSKKGGSSSVPSAPAKVWQPGVDKLEEGEELQFDPSAYNYLRAFSVGWPCLSFDIVHDSLGLVRTEFPHTVYGVAGTQAEKASWNYVGIFKLSNISGKKRKLVPASTATDDVDMDSESSSDEDDDEDESDGSSLPVLHLHKVWDFSSLLNALAESESGTSIGGNNTHQLSPIKKFGHKDEGYAIDWSSVVPGRFISGDCNSSIHLWEPSSETWNVDMAPFELLAWKIYNGVQQKLMFLLHVQWMEL